MTISSLWKAENMTIEIVFSSSSKQFIALKIFLSVILMCAQSIRNVKMNEWISNLAESIMWISFIQRNILLLLLKNKIIWIKRSYSLSFCCYRSNGVRVNWKYPFSYFTIIFCSLFQIEQLPKKASVSKFNFKLKEYFFRLLVFRKTFGRKSPLPS